MPCQHQEKAPMDRESSGRKAQSGRCSQYLQRATRGFCTGKSKACEKAQARGKNHREEHNNTLKIHKQAVLHVQEEQKGCYRLKGIKGYLGWMLAISFIPGLTGCSSEDCLEMLCSLPPWQCLGWAEADREQHTELSHPGAVLWLLQVSSTSVLSEIKQEECIITFSQISVDIVTPASAFLCRCTAPLLKPSFVSTKPKTAACSCQNQHSKPHSQKTESTQSIPQKFWQKKLPASLSTLQGMDRKYGVFFLFIKTFWYLKISFVPNLRGELQF